ncbi:hypothetical protein K9B35_14600 [Sphingomonas sp. R647]|uniref:hypothetical protein n=1 Tax=Sphingomonas sp. R647 TaxID=2875233 RepID=UPI001CD534CC|nr:hypothetical protein [Sphingomonas sp. R647]MCA1199205.1 hypothetical protein [Sphingomonas sp. R647]
MWLVLCRGPALARPYYSRFHKTLDLFFVEPAVARHLAAGAATGVSPERWMLAPETDAAGQVELPDGQPGHHDLLCGAINRLEGARIGDARPPFA